MTRGYRSVLTYGYIPGCVPGGCAGGRLAAVPAAGRGARRRGACTGKPPPRFFAAFQDTRRRRRWPWARALHTSGCGATAAGHEDAEESLFARRATRGVDDRLGGSEQSLALEHEQLESESMKAGFELMRLLTQAHLDLRAARERRRDDVTGADGARARSAEDGHERVRVMIYGPVTHLADRLPQEKQGEPVPAGRGAELGGQQSYSAGVIGRNAGAVAMAPFGAGSGPGQRAGRDPSGQTAVRGARGRHGRGLRGVLRCPPPGAVRPGDRAAARPRTGPRSRCCPARCGPRPRRPPRPARRRRGLRLAG